MVGLERGVGQRCGQILRLKKGIISKDFLSSGTGSQELKQINHPNPVTTNTRTASAFTSFHGNSIQKRIGSHIAKLALDHSEANLKKRMAHEGTAWGHRGEMMLANRKIQGGSGRCRAVCRERETLTKARGHRPENEKRRPEPEPRTAGLVALPF